MTLRVLLFAHLKDRFGQVAISVTLPNDSTGCALKEALSQREPVARPLLEVSRLAVGQEYVAWDHLLKEGDEVAVIPPVSGG